jgi:hypothetical protein
VLRIAHAAYGSLYAARATSAMARRGTSSRTKVTPRRTSPPGSSRRT